MRIATLIRRSRTVALTLVLGAFIMLGHEAKAQANNCAALSGTPLVCMENHSSFPIVAVQVSNSMTYGSGWIPIPGGPIPPGGMTIVRFPSFGAAGTAYHFLVVRTASGGIHVFPNINVYQTTKVLINGW